MELAEMISKYGAAATKKLASVAIMGEPEEQLRGPLETLIPELAGLAGRDVGKLNVIGETNLADLQTKPDFAVTYDNTLVGFIEVKAPGKGADPRKYKGHDKQQWSKLSALPNLLYTDGQSFSLWVDGQLDGDIVELNGDIESAGAGLTAPSSLLALFDRFLQWNPVSPKRPRQLAEMAARLCRLLRDEVSEQMSNGSPALTSLANDWRDLLFPSASDEQFADGYAQTVTFGLLLARAKGIPLDDGVGTAAKTLANTHSLMGTALRVLTQSTENDQTLTTSIKAMTRVFAVVDWAKVSKGESSAWLYFYEQFLAEYDPVLRKATGSYYTPTEVVTQMTRLVDDTLRTRFDRPLGFADENVTVLDPATGTGTFILSVLQRVSDAVKDEYGEGAVPGALAAAVKRMFAFEIQLGPFAVAQLRILAELADLGLPASQSSEINCFVTNTLGNPWIEDTNLGQLYEPISRSRRDANKVKRDRPIQVVIGNPPYKAASKGEGSWVESGDNADYPNGLLDDFFPPKEWGVGVHTKHLYNPYVYFWRWGTWKVFDHHAPDDDGGVVCFITVNGFLSGPGFQGMRSYLRERCDALWVIDCSPEGHQPAVSTRLFQGVQQPVSITIAVRDGSKVSGEMAPVWFRELAPGKRSTKFAELAGINIGDDGWEQAASGRRDPFLPAGDALWKSAPALDDLFRFDGSGMMAGRTWVIGPDSMELTNRWDALVAAPMESKAELFKEHKRDRPITKTLGINIPGFDDTRVARTIADEDGPCPPVVPIGFRSFDRQFVIADKRVINQANPTMWAIRGASQVFLTAMDDRSPVNGPAVTLSSLVPDLHHHSGRGGRVHPLYSDAAGTVSNVHEELRYAWETALGESVSSEDVMAYVAAVAAHPGYVTRFEKNMRTPGIRIPLTTDLKLFDRAVALGRRVIWLHTYGDRFVDAAAGRPPGAPRMSEPPKMTKAIGTTEADMPDVLDHDPVTDVLHIGTGEITNVSAAVSDYEVSGKNVLDQWFSYRRKTRERPVIGNKTRSALEEIHSEVWLAEYTVGLLDLLNVLGSLVEMEPDQDALVGEIVEGAVLTVAELESVGALPIAPDKRNLKVAVAASHQLTIED